MHKVGHFLGEPPLSLTGMRALINGLLQLRQLLLREEGEPPQIADNISISSIDEVLVPGVWTSHLRVEPQLASTRRLTKFIAVGIGDQWDCQGVHRCAINTTVQVHAGNNVSPLVTAANLQRTAVGVVQLNVVVGLKQHVGKLSVGDAVIIQAALNRVASEHGIERKVLSDVAQKLRHRQVLRPVVIVHEAGGVLAIKINKSRELVNDAIGPFRHLVVRQHSAFTDIAGVTDHAGGTTSKHNRVMPRLLETTQHQKRYQMPGVQRRAGWVEPAVQGNGLFARLAQLLKIRGLVNQAAPLQLINNVVRHDVSQSSRSVWVACSAGQGIASSISITGIPLSMRYATPRRGL